MASKQKDLMRWKSLKTRLATVVNKIEDSEINQENSEVYLQTVDKIWTEMETLHEEILQQTKAENVDQLIEEFTEEEMRVIDIKIKLQLPLKEVNQFETSYRSSSTAYTEVRLPSLDLPTFSGDVTGWTTFADLFKAAVHNNQMLSNAQKLQYLKGALKGEAAKLLRHLSISEANYLEAWDILQKRFENKRHIANTLAKKIIGLQGNKQQPLRELLDSFYEFERGLHCIVPGDKWELLVSNILMNCLDNDTLQAWELSLPSTDIPPLRQLLEFLEVRARALQTCGLKKTSKYHENFPLKKSQCLQCKEDHLLRQCKKFQDASIDARRSLVQRNHLCFNCLSSQHSVMECTSSSRCRKCQRKHHTMLHEDSKTSLVALSEGTTLLPTAIVEVEINGKKHALHSLLDTGSHVNIISGHTTNKLGLVKQTAAVQTQTLAGNCTLPSEVILDLKKGKWHRKVRCYVAENLDVTLPAKEINFHNWNHIRNVKLADPKFFMPRRIDLILGIDICSEIIEQGLRKGSRNEPVAQKTVLGWTLSGTTIQAPTSPVNFMCQVNQELRKFWELEELPQNCILSHEETCAKRIYEETTRRTEDGHFEVKYPFKGELPSLGESRNQAVSRYLRLEALLERKNLRKEYDEVLNEYLKLGHMVPLSESDKNQPSYYLPHHAVYKNSSTTKVRVVFDASARTSNGLSLNENMFNGPKVQDDLFHIILRFQKHEFAICADIEKMYRQIKMHPSHQNYQRIIWRTSSQKQLQDFKLTTVTFGMKASPFLATQTLQKLAADEEDKYPEASNVLRNDFYVDDMLTGANSKEAAISLCTDLNNLLKAGGFTLRKWCSNDAQIIEKFENENNCDNVIIGEDETVKTLGLLWKPQRDIFSFKVQLTTRETHTKRTLLSDTCRIFDPLGWLSPVIITAKIMFQDLWRLPLTWDQELPHELQEKWIRYRQDLNLVEKTEIPRFLPYKVSEELMLCGFCDASEKAYGAVIYIRSSYNKKFQTKILVAKSRVCPLKSTTIPRLELCAAVLLARLMKETVSALKLELPTYYWSDSSVVLHWISQSPSRWKTFVSHRVSEIQQISEPSHWFHVSTSDNPADLISRGVSAEKLVTSNLWWTGPSWLKQEIFPKSTVQLKKPVPEEKVHKPLIALSVTAKDNFIQKYSNLDKLLRITALVLRFIKRTRKETSSNGPILLTEINEALNIIIRITQQEVFGKELAALKGGKSLSRKSEILSLTPFIDDQGVLRVGGRLLNAPLSFSQKHQILLPYNHHLTNLILNDIHRKNLHAGNQLMLSTLRQKFWLPKAKQVIRRFIHKCVICVRHKAKFSEQLMGQLPQQRVTPSRPFLHTGVDYCGPINCKDMIGRGRKTFKSYIAVFVCMATKAIHLEPVPSLSMESFLSVFARFTSRRGVPSDIYSDNGKNFVAANRHLKELYEMLRQEENQALIHNKLMSQGIQWHFIPPYSPNFGGLWEAGVKSLKYHLRRIMGNDTLTYEELATVLCKIEACLNSRPLCSLSAEKDDFEALTPGHFLIGQPINAVPDQAPRTTKSLQARFRLQQKLTNDLWRRWQNEYLSTLQSKTKWKLRSQPIQVGDLVLVKEMNLPPQQWKLARVTSTSQDAVGQSRVIQLRTAHGTTSRALSQIVKLFSENSQ